jgi:hypothetical protein
VWYGVLQMTKPNTNPNKAKGHSMDKLADAKAYVTEQFENFGDNGGWLEGWICGFTDPNSNNDNEMYEQLFDHLDKLRKDNDAKSKN